MYSRIDEDCKQRIEELQKEISDLYLKIERTPKNTTDPFFGELCPSFQMDSFHKDYCFCLGIYSPNKGCKMNGNCKRQQVIKKMVEDLDNKKDKLQEQQENYRKLTDNM